MSEASNTARTPKFRQDTYAHSCRLIFGNINSLGPFFLYRYLCFECLITQASYIRVAGSYYFKLCLYLFLGIDLHVISSFIYSFNIGLSLDSIFVDVGMFKDPAFQMRATLDKRGRKLKSSRKNEDMHRYYRLKEEEDWMLKSRSEKTMDENREDSMAGRKGSAREKISIEKESEVDAKEGHRSRKGSNNESSVSREKKALDASETEDEEQGDENEREEEEVVDNDDSDLDDEEDLARQRWLRMRGLAGPDTSSESDDDDDVDKDDADVGNGSIVFAEDSSSSSYSSDDEQQQQHRHGNEDKMDDDGSDDEDSELKAALEQWGVGAMAANPSEQVPLLPDATHRIAVVDLDWEHVRAVDIFATLRSFLPKGGRLEKVTVYPSDYGLERMVEEAVSGPQNVWKKTGKERDQNGVANGNRYGDDDDGPSDTMDDSDEVEEGSSSEDDGPLLEDASSDEHSSEGEDEDDDDGGEVDPVQLRLYERSKLRWYYAIAEFDSAATANAIYEECDGMEFLKCKGFLFVLSFSLYLH